MQTSRLLESTVLGETTSDIPRTKLNSLIGSAEALAAEIKTYRKPKLAKLIDELVAELRVENPINESSDEEGGWYEIQQKFVGDYTVSLQEKSISRKGEMLPVYWNRAVVKNDDGNEIYVTKIYKEEEYADRGDRANATIRSLASSEARRWVRQKEKQS